MSIAGLVEHYSDETKQMELSGPLSLVQGACSQPQVHTCGPVAPMLLEVGGLDAEPHPLVCTDQSWSLCGMWPDTHG